MRPIRAPRPASFNGRMRSRSLYPRVRPSGPLSVFASVYRRRTLCGNDDALAGLQSDAGVRPDLATFQRELLGLQLLAC